MYVHLFFAYAFIKAIKIGLEFQGLLSFDFYFKVLTINAQLCFKNLIYFYHFAIFECQRICILIQPSRKPVAFFRARCWQHFGVSRAYL